jgi:uncharacterized protein
MQAFIAFLAGLLFGIGLILSEMTNPAKVLGFLDLMGSWDPSLAFVMAGAIAVGSIGFRLAKGRTKALLGDWIRMPAVTRIDRPLVLGSLTFGIGWGLAGYCPGPAVVSVAQGGVKPLVFVLAMLAGMVIHKALTKEAA